MNRKGFPESYDTRRLLQFLRELKSGAAEVAAPRCTATSSTTSSTGEEIVVRQPDIVILEGLNVLQVGPTGVRREFVSDYFDF